MRLFLIFSLLALCGCASVVTKGSTSYAESDSKAFTNSFITEGKVHFFESNAVEINGTGSINVDHDVLQNEIHTTQFSGLEILF